ncbi:MAG: lipoate--protein ligase [Bacteroidales bacterium]|nr:lipoate--protein ligase [Bacteroidales bacterium]
MLCIRLDTTDPCFNLAVDEYLLKTRSEDFLVLSVNFPSVIIGKHQVAHREADTEFVTGAGIPVIRRISGGGAVYHDAGNVNFSFILSGEQGHQVDFRKYTLPVISFLRSLGVDAVFEGKNDLKAGGLKISGNAEHVFRQRVLHHGTLLFDADLNVLRKSLRKDTSCYHTRGVRSNPSAVVNLKTLIPGMETEGFILSMMDYFISMEGNHGSVLTAAETAAISDLADSRYRKWEWNFAYGPEYTFRREFKYDGKNCRLSLFVKDGIIEECSIEGSARLNEMLKGLKGLKHMPGEINNLPLARIWLRRARKGYLQAAGEVPIAIGMQSVPLLGCNPCFF